MNNFPVAKLGASAILAALILGCTSKPMSNSASADSAGSTASGASASSGANPVASVIPAGETGAAARIQSSPRHGEYVMIKTGANDSVRAYVVYPERSTNAPVVVAVHDIYGMGSWIRGVADQLAADGFIAIAPDLITGSGLLTDSAVKAGAPALIRSLKRDDVQRRISEVANYGMGLPSAIQRYGVVGFCWGGSTVFTHAVDAPTLGASVVYYGTSPDNSELSKIKAPVLGLYGAEDARVNSTISAADSVLSSMNKRFEYQIFDGAGHGFLRNQEGMNGANMAAATQAWPKTIEFLRENLGR